MRMRIGAGLVLGAVAWSAEWAGATIVAAPEAAVATKLDAPFVDPLPAALTAPGGGQERLLLRTCRDYLAVKDRLVGSDSEADFRVLRAKAVDCEMLALTGRAAARSAPPRDFLTATGTRLYPASLWTNVSDDERAKAARPGSTLQAMSATRRFKVSRPDTLVLENPAYGVRLVLLARGDFNGDGWEDAAFRWSGYARHGSYRDARLVVLTRIDTRPSSGFVEWTAAPSVPRR